MDKRAGETLRIAEVTLDVARGCLRGPDGAEVPLAPKPFDLLLALARQAGRTVAKDALLDAVWPGVHVTEDSLFQAVREARRAIGDPEGRVLRSVPRRGYMLEAAVTQETPALAPPEDRPSLVVLPFQNLSADPEQDYFVDGLVEDITTALARTRWLFVIARSSAFTYRGRALDVREVGRELGVRYALQGSVRRAGGMVRIACQLCETETGGTVWAERLDGDLADVFALQDRVMEEVAGAIEPNLRHAEIERARRKVPGDLNAYDLYLRAHALVDGFTPDTARTMFALCERAVGLDAHLTRAYALGARANIQLYVQGWMKRGEGERAAALAWIERGLESDRHDALMLAEAGQSFAWFGGQLDRAIACLDEAVGSNPFLLEPLLKSGLVRNRAGQTRIASEHLRRALRLSPRDSRRYAIYEGLAMAHLIERELEEALGWARRAVQHNGNYLAAWRALAGVSGHLGLEEEAREAVARMRAIWPAFSVSLYRDLFPISAPEKWAYVFDGLRRAGLPEA